MGMSYAHSYITHSLGQYVNGDVTTNRVEGAFSHFKRTMVGTYHKASAKHLDRYMQMFAFRWNRRSKGKGKSRIVFGEDARVNDLSATAALGTRASRAKASPNSIGNLASF
jgi:hypothetical protein